MGSSGTDVDLGFDSAEARRWKAKVDGELKESEALVNEVWEEIIRDPADGDVILTALSDAAKNFKNMWSDLEKTFNTVSQRIDNIFSSIEKRIQEVKESVEAFTRNEHL